MDSWPRHATPRLDPQTKTLGATERDAQASAADRERGAERAADDFVIVDAGGSTIKLTPLSARAPRGERARGAVPRNTDPTTTLLAAMTTAGMGPALTLEGAPDTAAFESYVAQCLAPALSPGKVVVLDNLRAHKSPRVRALIEARGCAVWFVPASAPDVSPIEEACSTRNALLRRAAARTRAALAQAIAEAVDEITAADARGYFAHCGYRVKTMEVQ